MEHLDAESEMPGNPYSDPQLVRSAKKSVYVVRPEPVKPSDSIKTYTSEEAKNLEIVPFASPDENPFGSLSLDFTEHFKQITKDAESISDAKMSMDQSVALPRPTEKTSVGDLVKSLKDGRLNSIKI